MNGHTTTTTQCITTNTHQKDCGLETLCLEPQVTFSFFLLTELMLVYIWTIL